MRLDEHVIHSNLLVGLDLNRGNRKIGGAFESTGQVINSAASDPDMPDSDLRNWGCARGRSECAGRGTSREWDSQ